MHKANKLQNRTTQDLDATKKDCLDRLNTIKARVEQNWCKEGEVQNLSKNIEKYKKKLSQTEHELEVFKRESEQRESNKSFKILNYDTYSIRELYGEELHEALINIVMDGYPDYLKNQKTFEWFKDNLDSIWDNHEHQQ